MNNCCKERYVSVSLHCNNIRFCYVHATVYHSEHSEWSIDIIFWTGAMRTFNMHVCSHLVRRIQSGTQETIFKNPEKLSSKLSSSLSSAPAVII